VSLYDKEQQIATGEVQGYTWDTARITGHVHQALSRGWDPNLDVPLANPVEGTNLWQGGCMQGIRLPDDFKYVISLYPWEKYAIGENTVRWEYTLYDSVDQDSDPFEQIASQAAQYEKMGKTLIHCQAGLNRSGLIAARVLMLNYGFTGAEAIQKLRDGRDRLVLSNPAFEAYLIGLEVGKDVEE
jgi:protein-tyrosine phosphatase